MKKIAILVLTLVLLLSITVGADAASTYSYQDKDNGNTLSVPKDWDLEHADDSLIKIKFVPNGKESALMQYGSADLWENLSSRDKQEVPRSEFDNSQASKSDIADLFKCSTKDVKLVTIDGTEYYRAAFEKKTTSGKYSVSIDVTYWVRFYDGWIYIYQYAGNESSDLYDTFKEVIASATYGGGVSTRFFDSGSEEDIYEDAIKAYERGQYFDAEDLFNEVSDYKDSSKYLRLIRIRNAGGNIGVGSAVYQKSCGLTTQDKKDIDAAARDFYFADTAEVLLCNSDVACYYLVGKWNGGSKCYIHFSMNDYGGTYNIGSKLSTNYQGTFSINDGEVRVDVCGSNALTLQLALTAPDCMEVLTYEKGRNIYTLTRN